MVFIFGANEEYDRLGYVLLDCKRCGYNTLFSLHQSRARLTLFFVPTFSFMQKHYLRCENCGLSFELKKGELKDYVAQNILNEQQAQAFVDAEIEKHEDNKTRHIIAEYERFRQQKMAEARPVDEATYTDVFLTCPRCYGQINSKMKFCPHCGKKIKQPK